MRIMFTDKFKNYENLLTWYVGYDIWNWTPMRLISWTRPTGGKNSECNCKRYQQP